MKKILTFSPNPFTQLQQWVQEEKEQGAPAPQQAVLSTATQQCIPHARVVAIREIHEKGLLFFTQTGTRKVEELRGNPQASLTFWFELFQREVILEGEVFPLTTEDNKSYWESYPRTAQIRFYSYAETSSQPIPNKQDLENKKREIDIAYQDRPLPVSPFYCGFRVKPARMVFYAYRSDELSDVVEYTQVNGEWQKTLLSP